MGNVKACSASVPEFFSWYKPSSATSFHGLLEYNIQPTVFSFLFFFVFQFLFFIISSIERTLNHV